MESSDTRYAYLLSSQWGDVPALSKNRLVEERDDGIVIGSGAWTGFVSKSGESRRVFTNAEEAIAAFHVAKKAAIQHAEWLHRRATEAEPVIYDRVNG